VDIYLSTARYTILTKQEQDGGFSGQCLELPGAISQGETLEELKANMEDAIKLMREPIEAEAKDKNE
jgi:predicted RNase H-like HicB family nuclease